MLVSLNWLKELIRIPAGVDEIARRLTMTGCEVEEIRRPGEKLRDIFIGKVLSLEPHPTREGLQVARVDYGGGQKTCTTAAPNVAVGKLFPYAPPGGVLADDTVLGVRDFDGVLSEGMLLSAEELGIPDVEVEFGLLALPEDAPQGEDCIAWLGLDDVILDLSITPNRGDLLSLVGIARELYGILPGTELLPLEVPALPEGPWPIPFEGITLEDEGCPTYSLGLIRNVRIGPSPVRSRVRVSLCGMRPISNVVDATNLVMLFWGQPLHAFDLDRLPARHIAVRTARKGETITTLDGKERVLEEEDLLITSGGVAVGLAGVMGGANSEISDDTATVVLESASFDRVRIGRTSRRMGLHSEAAFRYARGVDRTKALPALAMAMAYMRDFAGGELCGAPLVAGDPREPHRTASLRASTLRTYLMSADMDKASATLERFGFSEVRERREEAARTFAVPPARLDVSIEEDLVEEVARVEGYDTVPVRIPPHLYASASLTTLMTALRRLRESAMGRGFVEMITYSFVGPEDLRVLRFPEGDRRGNPIAVVNPIAADQSVMRTSLLPGLLKALLRNLRGGFRGPIRMFEQGKVFLRVDDAVSSGEEHEEPFYLGGIVFPGRDRRFADDEDFFSVKADVVALCESCAVRPEFVQAEEPFGHKGRTARIRINGKDAGYLLALKPLIGSALDLDAPLYAFEIDLESLVGQVSYQFTEPMRYPAIYRDVSLLVPKGTPAAVVEAEMRRFAGDFLWDVRLFDVYEGEGIPEGYRSLAFSVAYRSAERTLSDEEIEGSHGALRSGLATGGYALR